VTDSRVIEKGEGWNGSCKPSYMNWFKICLSNIMLLPSSRRPL
jgi:hypothetical protein